LGKGKPLHYQALRMYCGVVLQGLKVVLLVRRVLINDKEVSLAPSRKLDDDEPEVELPNDTHLAKVCFGDFLVELLHCFFLITLQTRKKLGLHLLIAEMVLREEKEIN